MRVRYAQCVLAFRPVRVERRCRSVRVALAGCACALARVLSGLRAVLGCFLQPTDPSDPSDPTDVRVGQSENPLSPFVRCFPFSAWWFKG